MNGFQQKKRTMGTAPVFFTAISTILGAILFLRFGYAVGSLGFGGVVWIIILGHLVTIPTALAISELATNQRVEGGGEYFIISRSFGLNIGATIGIALYLSQTISVAFYVIAFTEAFEPLFSFIQDNMNFNLPKQAISIPAMIGLAYLILKKGSGIGVKTLYFVVTILFVSLVIFFLGNTGYEQTAEGGLFSSSPQDSKGIFFVVFAIIFPAFTGMTAGVGLSGDLKNPARSIPWGTISATLLGMVVYIFIAWKLFQSFPLEYLAPPHPNPPHESQFVNQLAMRELPVFGIKSIPFITILLGLAASTISSAIGSILVAPRTLQALSIDRSIPFFGANKIFAKGKGETAEPHNATLITSVIAIVFVALGDVNAVAQIISMFFMVTYGSICLISFLYHFGADPSYRPSFRSKWIISLTGFLMCIFLMFKISTTYALLAIVIMTCLYLLISTLHRSRNGMQEIFKGAFFQLSRNLQIYMQKSKKASKEDKWRPSAICISNATFERRKVLKVMDWIAYKYGFGSYIHYVEDYFSTSSNEKAKEILGKIIELTNAKSHVYYDTLISPSYTSAIAQIIQLPGISGMENNMILFEFDKMNPSNLPQIIENIPLARAANLDVCILGSIKEQIVYKHGIHVWITSIDYENSNLMILLSYILLAHPDWRKGKIKIFDICREEEFDETRQNLVKIIQTGRLPIAPNNIELIKLDQNISAKSIINERSKDAGLTIIGFRIEQLKYNQELFIGYNQIGDVLFINAFKEKEIT